MELYATKHEDDTDSPKYRLAAVARPNEWPLVLTSIDTHYTLTGTAPVSLLPDMITSAHYLDHDETAHMMQGLAYLARPLGVRALDSTLRKVADLPVAGPILTRALGAPPRDIGTPSSGLARAARKLRKEALHSVATPTEP